MVIIKVKVVLDHKYFLLGGAKKPSSSYKGPLAHLVEHGTFNPCVPSSNLGWPSNQRVNR